MLAELISVSNMRLKCILHTHTRNSDGMLTADETITYLRSKGYRVIAITDHNKITTVENPYTDTLVLHGYEDTFSIHIVHIEDELYKAGTGLVFLAHPSRWGYSVSKIKEVVRRYNLDGVELYNRGNKQFITTPINDDDRLFYNRALLLAVDDFHSPTMENKCWIEIDTDSLDKYTVLDKIRHKEYILKVKNKTIPIMK